MRMEEVEECPGAAGGKSRVEAECGWCGEAERQTGRWVEQMEQQVSPDPGAERKQNEPKIEQLTRERNVTGSEQSLF